MSNIILRKSKELQVAGSRKGDSQERCCNGKECGKCLLYTILWSIIIITSIVLIMMIVILFSLSLTMGIILLAIDVVFFLVLGICCCCIIVDDGGCREALNDKKCKHLKYWILGGIVMSIIFASIIIIIQQNTMKHCLGSYSQTSMVIQSNTCNNFLITYFSMESDSNLESIEIGNDCFRYVNTFVIDGLNELKSLVIGINSFTKNKYSNGNDESRSFSISNCDELESIEIGLFSFSDYGGGFELRNISKLSTIKVGEVGSYSFNFYYSSFVIEDLPHLNSITLGDQTFEYSLSTMISNLPYLNSIKLGESVLIGKNDLSCSLIMENLPNLTSITSVGNSFFYPQSITLSNIPNLQTVKLPDSFWHVQSKSITNVSPVLADLLPFTLDDIDINSTSISIPNGVDTSMRSLYFSRFTLLEELIIGDDCFGSVDEFNIDGLNELKLLKIGNNSFTLLKSNDEWDWNKANNASRSFSILNCIELESIEIGEFSFIDYGGGFELRNLPKLTTIKIGEIGIDSSNFCYSSFVIKDLPHLQSIELGDAAFYNSLSTIISNLPHLNSIKLGSQTLYGRWDNDCSLKMENLPNLESITSELASFNQPRSITLSNIPNLEIVDLPDSFEKVTSRSVTNVSPIFADLVEIS